MSGRRLTAAIRSLSLGMILLGSSGACAQQVVPIVLGAQADRLERLAAEELATWLTLRSPNIASRLPEQGPAIVVGTLKSAPRLTTLIDRSALSRSGSYVVTTRRDGDRQLGIIAGADPRAVLHAVYALAEHLGRGFYLSYNAAEPAAAKADRPFSFAGWDLQDAPLVQDRIVFDWHNFLSSCSTWDLPQWKHWIVQTARMRYSAIMVHAYGNNPMVQFTFNGQTKPVGYLTTTARGRDWGTQHVNDVRRLVGAEGVFDGPVFGAKAALVPEDERAAAAKALMKQVFTYAKDRGVDVVFALDVDTDSSNPPAVIETLPAAARFTANGRPFANPDTAEGYAYYRAQIESLLGDYPQIDQLIVWFRTGRTPWRDLTEKDFPETWKAEYHAALAAAPRAAGLKDSASMFAIAKIVRAFRKALDGMGRRGVKLGTGTWHFGHMEAADFFMPAEVPFLALDWATQFDTPEIQKLIRDIGVKRPMIPIVWAHHDDRTYIGRSYTPYADFARKLHEGHAAGFGIIHWTTRPLDLYFKSLAQQVWQGTANEPLEKTCREMAARTFGPAYGDSLGKYLLEWVTTAPQFGRETSDRFIDQALADPQASIARAQKRLAMLDAADKAGLDPLGAAWLAYYRGMERFTIDFYRNETALQESVALLGRGDLAGARKSIQSCRPETVIQQYAAASKQGGISRGEAALIISMNLRWLPYFEGQRQALGLAPLRVNFQPTQHDPLAQGAGHRTFFLDPQKQLWLGLGEKEIGVPAVFLSGARRGSPDPAVAPRSAQFSDPAADSRLDVCDTAIATDQPAKFSLRTMVGSKLAKGDYTVEILLPRPADVAAAPAVFDLVLTGSKAPAVTERIELARTAGDETQPSKRTYSLRVDRGQLDVELSPVRGKAVLCGVVLRAK